jgi:hypothetical protein
MRRAATRIRRLVDDLVDDGAVAAARCAVAPGPHDPVVIAPDALARLRRRAAAKDVRAARGLV